MSETHTAPEQRPGYRLGGTTGAGFKPGRSGNPNGPARRKVNGKTLPELAREHTESAINLLARVVKDSRKPLDLRLDAAGRLLTLGWGRAPVATVNANVQVPVERLSTRELLAIVQGMPQVTPIEAQPSRQRHSEVADVVPLPLKRAPSPTPSHGSAAESEA